MIDIPKSCQRFHSFGSILQSDFTRAILLSDMTVPRTGKSLLVSHTDILCVFCGACLAAAANMKQVFSEDTSIHLKFIECGMKFW